MSNRIKNAVIYTGGTTNKRITFADPTIIATATSITARLIKPDGGLGTAIGNEIVAPSNFAGADWANGIVIVPFDNADTALYAGSEGAGNWIRLVVTVAGEPRVFMTRPMIEIRSGFVS